MKSLKDPLSQLANALPKHLDFYHLGEVKMETREPSPDESLAIAYHLSQEPEATLVLLIGKSADPSIYSELGNILASRIAPDEISPPQILNQNQLDLLLANSKSIIRNSYTHFAEDSLIPIETLILSTSMRGVGHA